MSNKLAKDDTLQSLVTANQAISTGLGLLAKDASMQQLITAIQELRSGSSGGGGGITDSEVTINDGVITISGGEAHIHGGSTYVNNVPLILSGDAYELFDNTTALDGMGAAIHNAFWRGQNLGTTITAEQSAQIRNGQFHGLWVGDYWEREISYIDSSSGAQLTRLVRMRIAHFDYRYENGTLTHHVAVIPEWPFYFTIMNGSNTNTNGYAGSLMFTRYLAGAAGAFLLFFGTEHVLPYTLKCTNTQGNNTPANVGWIEKQEQTCDLMNLTMVFGDFYKNVNKYGDMDKTALAYTADDQDTEQLALFKMNSGFRIAQTSSTVTTVKNWWLRDVYSTQGFACVNVDGDAIFGGAYSDNGNYWPGVRPLALIY